MRSGFSIVMRLVEGERAGRRVDRELAVGSADDRIGQRRPASGSVAVTVVTAVVFSAIDAAAVSPPPFDVIVGTSFWLVTVIAMA